MREGLFRFKHFDCKHTDSSMKIGVDAVILGATADVRGIDILDVGTGCGVIALICAQRNPDAHITAIDIDPKSVDEATDNFKSSPWAERLKAKLEDFNTIKLSHFDLIISNPPFFNAGVSDLNSSRLCARHQGALSPETLLSTGCSLLKPGGRIAMIVPADQADQLIHISKCYNLWLEKQVRFRNHPEAAWKRCVLQFINVPCEDPQNLRITMFDNPEGEPTSDYRDLCREFYLKF